MIERFKALASKLLREFSVSFVELRAMIDEVGSANAFDSDAFILKNENMALQKTIEGLENELAEALEKEDQLKADLEIVKQKYDLLQSDFETIDVQKQLL
jgi:predicted RNase H-like nuclease (RuvC/YqgF family)